MLGYHLIVCFLFQNLEKLPRTETVATFAETDGNIFYLYEDTNELIPMINEKSATVTVNTQENHHQPDMQNSAFELVSFQRITKFAVKNNKFSLLI